MLGLSGSLMSNCSKAKIEYNTSSTLEAASWVLHETSPVTGNLTRLLPFSFSLPIQLEAASNSSLKDYHKLALAFTFSTRFEMSWVKATKSFNFIELLELPLLN